MVVVSREVPFDQAEVFSVVADPRTYPHWLVGAREIRAVDQSWPRRGTRFHHRVGLIGPLKVADSSVVLDVDPPARLSLEVRARPLGRARATFSLAETAERRGRDDLVPRTRIELDEVPLGRLRWFRWVVDPITAARNRRSLDQFADFLESGRSHRFPG